jgi:hypothetical protein
MSAHFAHAPRWLRSAVALAVFFTLTATAAAQTETGRITGVVTDATGGILPGVTVNAKAVGTGAMRTVITDSAGQYVFANLPPAQYEITTELAGFNPANAKVTVSVGGAFSVPLKMDVAGTKENINVVAEVRASTRATPKSRRRSPKRRFASCRRSPVTSTTWWR